ncbi:cylicin-1 [Acomys russatus]|uniref:cylicin-1 n=1 Tax=Acomys russatus TaxID=60746 RepID=UPI0021E25039|nr:cylicin-1 [Acomys russatus]
MVVDQLPDFGNRLKFSSGGCVPIRPTIRQEVNSSTNDDCILINQTKEKLNQEQCLALTFSKILMPNMKRSGPSELEVAIPRQEKKKIKKGQKSTQVWINHFLRDILLRSSFSLASIIEAPFKHLYNPQNHYIMAEMRKPKDDKRTTKKAKEKVSSCAIILKSRKMITDGNLEIIDNTEKIPSKSSHKSELLNESIFTSETILESNNSTKTLEMESNNGSKDSMNSQENNDEATCYKDNTNTDCKNSLEEFSDNISKCVSSLNMDLMLLINELRDESKDFEGWATNFSQNNAKKPTKKGGKKEKDSDPDSGDTKDAKKEGKKKEKKESRKKKNIESTDAESVDSRDAKKEPKTDKREKKKKKDAESTSAESGDSKDSKKEKKKKNEDKKSAESVSAEAVDSKSVKKETRRAKKDDKKDAFFTDSESDTESKKIKKDGKNENKKNKRKPVKEVESTDADSESEGDQTLKKGEKDNKIPKKGEKKDVKKKAESTTASESDFEVKTEKKEAKKDTRKDIRSYTDSGSDGSSKGGMRIIRPSDTESEELSGLKVMKTTDDSDVTSADSKKGISEIRKGFRSSSKKTTFGEKGKSDAVGRIPSSRQRLPLPPCEPFKASTKPKRVCQCKATPPPPPKPRYAPLPGVEWIHKLL